MRGLLLGLLLLGGAAGAAEKTLNCQFLYTGNQRMNEVLETIDRALGPSCLLGTGAGTVQSRDAIEILNSIPVYTDINGTRIGSFDLDPYCNNVDDPWDCCTNPGEGPCRCTVSAAGISCPGFNVFPHKTDGRSISIPEGLDDGTSTVNLKVSDAGIPDTVTWTVADKPSIAVIGGPGGSTMSVNSGAALDGCTCRLFYLDRFLFDLDRIGYRLSTADSDADEVLQLGIYSRDGLTQYAQCAATTTGTAAQSCANSIASPPTMGPGDYWFCAAHNNAANDQIVFVANDYGRGFTFTQTCTSGVIPATLTSPTATAADDVRMPNLMLTDE